MKSRFFVFLLVLVFASVPVFAARQDVATRLAAADEAGAANAAAVTINRVEVWMGNFDLTVESEVWFDPDSLIYTYFYHLHSNSATDAVESFNMFGDWVGGGSAALDWGIVTGETTAGVGLDGGGGDISFGVTMTANFNDGGAGNAGGLDMGETITFYAQSTRDPGLFEGNALDGGQTSGQAFAPTPEPASLLLFGSGMLAGLGALRRKLS